MVLYYKYENKLIKMKNSNFISIENYSIIKMNNALKTSLTRRFKMRIEDYLYNEYNIKIKKCAFCDEYSDFNMKYELKPYKKSYIVTISDVYYDKLYCKSKNKNCDGKKLNPNSIEFVSKAYSMSKEESLKFIHSRNKSPFYECNHKSKEDYRKYQSIRDRFIDDNNKYDEYIKNLKYSKTIDYYIEKYGEVEGKNIWYEIQSKKDSMSFNHFLHKNNFNLKKTIKQYNERLKSVRCFKGVGGSYSKQSFNLFNDIIEKLKLNKENIIFGENEYFIKYYDENLKKTRKYYYDFVDIKNNIIIEYNGINWHPNKEKMSDEKYKNWYHPFDKNIKRSVLEQKDYHKQKIAEEKNFNFLTLWNTETNQQNMDIVYNYYKNKKII